MFRYSGSKKRLLKHLPGPHFGNTTIVEPFAGSLAYSMSYRPPRNLIAAEANPLVRGLLEWLRQEATEERLTELEALRADLKDKVNLISLGLPEPETTLLRLMTSGAYVGQLSSKVHYAQHSFKLGGLKDDLPYLRRTLRPLFEDFLQCEEACNQPNTMAFVDPPYLGTEGNYKSKGKDHGGLDAKAVQAFVLRLKCPVLMTYGDGCQETFPALTWEKAVTRKVPILRGGGTKERTEWYARLNWRT
jgi:site-specific DNA-adenine methylase